MRVDLYALALACLQGHITKQEFFLYALVASSRKVGSGLTTIFAQYDVDESGTLNELEFTEACEVPTLLAWLHILRVVARACACLHGCVLCLPGVRGLVRCDSCSTLFSAR